jgi:hypothetical protein
MPFKDKQAAKDYHSARYQANKQEYVERKVKVQKRNQDFLVEYLNSNPCVDCGESDIRCLEFDHLDRADKVISISEAVHSGHSIKKIQEEIAKCKVRCANCHKKITCEQFNWYKQGR